MMFLSTTIWFFNMELTTNNYQDQFFKQAIRLVIRDLTDLQTTILQSHKHKVVLDEMIVFLNLKSHINT